jgi:membrane protease YdiL (CAAX protease family)
VIQGLTLKSGWVWPAFIAAMIHPLFVSMIAALPFVSRLVRLGDHAYFLSFWTTMVAAHWTVAVIIVVCLRLSGAGTSAIGLQLPQPKILLVLAAVALGIAAAISRMPVHTSAMKQPLLPTLPWTHAERFFMLLVVAPTAAVCEETIYRGFLLRFVTTLTGFWPAVAVQALLFAYMHGGLSQPLFLFVDGSILGFLFGLLVNWRGNLRTAMALHFLIDAVQLTLIAT